MKDYNIQLKIRNNYLLTAMRENGIENAHQLSRASGVYPSKIGEYLNLKRSPYMKNGDLYPSIVKIAEYLNRGINQLFPEEHMYVALEKNTGEVEISSSEVSNLLSDFSPTSAIESDERKQALLETLEKLTSREREVISLRFGFDGEEMTLQQVGDALGVTAPRIRQIEHKALRKLRNPKNSENYR